MKRRTSSARSWVRCVALTAAVVCVGSSCGTGGSVVAKPDRASAPQDSGSNSGGAMGSGGGSDGSNVDSASKLDGPPLEKIRVANLYTAKGGGPGPDLDVYDYASDGAAAPIQILSKVSYGTISKYVQPPTIKAVDGSRIFYLGVALAGSKVTTQTDLQGIGGASTDPPEYDPQVTIVLTADPNDQESQPDELAGISHSQIAEKLGPDKSSDTPSTLPPKPSGGEFIVDTNRLDSSGPTNNYYLKIDGTCVKPTNANDAYSDPFPMISSQDSHSLGMIYDVPPGSHTLTVGISAEQNVPPASCDALVDLGDTVVQADAGTQVLAVLYSSDSSKTVKVAAAPIDA